MMNRMNAVTCLTLLLLASCAGTQPAAADDRGWQDQANRTVLKNDAVEATFQSGILVQLRDVAGDKLLLNADAKAIASSYPAFGSGTIDLNNSTIQQTADEKTVRTVITTSDGNELTFTWSIEPGRGDLIADLSAKSAKPVEELRMIIPGADINSHTLVWVNGYGVGRTEHAPWSESVIGNPLKDGSPGAYSHPLCALFQRDAAGWWVEGRDEKVGPSTMMIQGTGEAATIGFTRRFGLPTTTPQLFQIRIRTYRDHWEDAVDPFIKWMETGAGYVPLDKQKPEWVRNISNQAYIRVGDFDTLENLAKQVDPNRTLIGRMVGAWIHPMDFGYPDYTLNETAKQWIKRTRELGFHVGVHFNTFGISSGYPDLLKRFKEGLLVTGKDEKGNDKYQEVGGANRHVYCSPALKAWRAYLIEQIKPAVDAGVDLVYLDESMAAMGNPYVDGMTSTEGDMTLMKEIKAAYPNVALETEQFNPMSARHSSFALSQMPLGHPLGGYIFNRYVNVVAEGVMGQPSDAQIWDAWTSWGYMLPNGNGRDEAWLQVVRAFQKYNLKPDSREDRREFLKFDSHPSSGLMPHEDASLSEESVKYFGYKGTGDVKAFFERKGNRRGLVIHEPGKDPQWVGVRIGNVSDWSGPGVLRDFVPGSETMVDWLIYSSKKQLALDKRQSYILDESGTLPQDRFHVTGIPKDFAFYSSGEKRIEPQYAGPKNEWFKLNFSGHGEMSLFVPDKVLVFLDGKEVEIDRQTNSARINVEASPEKPSTLLAFQQSTTRLSGRWVSLPWHTPPAQRSWYVTRHVIEDVSPDGPVRLTRPGYGFWSHVGGTAMILGTFPDAKRIRLQGAFGMREEAQFNPGAAVIRINGEEVMRLPGGARPYQLYSFDVDATKYAGKPVFLEFTIEGTVNGANFSDWFNPQIIVEGEESAKAGL